jgi:hypothetical protein
MSSGPGRISAWIPAPPGQTRVTSSGPGRISVWIPAPPGQTPMTSSGPARISRRTAAPPSQAPAVSGGLVPVWPRASGLRASHPRQSGRQGQCHPVAAQPRRRAVPVVSVADAPRLAAPAPAAVPLPSSRATPHPPMTPVCRAGHSSRSDRQESARPGPVALRDALPEPRTASDAAASIRAGVALLHFPPVHWTGFCGVVWGLILPRPRAAARRRRPSGALYSYWNPRVIRCYRR